MYFNRNDTAPFVFSYPNHHRQSYSNSFVQIELNHLFIFSFFFTWKAVIVCNTYPSCVHSEMKILNGISGYHVSFYNLLFFVLVDVSLTICTRRDHMKLNIRVLVCVFTKIHVITGAFDSINNNNKKSNHSSSPSFNIIRIAFYHIKPIFFCFVSIKIYDSVVSISLFFSLSLSLTYIYIYILFEMYFELIIVSPFLCCCRQ